MATIVYISPCPTPPPSYDEIDSYCTKAEAKLPLEKEHMYIDNDVEQPPEYDAAVAMLSQDSQSQICSEDNEKLGSSNVVRRKVSF